MCIKDASSGFFTPSFVTEEILFSYNCKDGTKRLKDVDVVTGYTNFKNEFGVHVDEYIKRKGL